MLKIENKNGTRDENSSAQRMFKKTLNCKIKTSPENGQPHPFHPTQLLFWTLPEQLSILHHACEPTHPEPTSQDTLQTSIRKCSSHTSLFRTLPEQLLTDDTTHVCQPWTNVAKTHHKTSDPKIFISHIPVLNFAGAALHITPRMCANPSWTNVPRHTTNFNPKMFISHIPVSNFARTTLNRWHHACVPTHPEPMLQRHTTKPQTLRFSSHTSLFWTLPEQLSILHHACEPTHPEPTSQDTLQTSIRKCSSHTSLFRTLPEQLLTDDTTHVCQPWTNVAKTHHKTSDPKIFISHIPVLNFAGAALHITPRMWANPSWTNVPRHTTNFNPKIFISHIPVSNFARTTLNRWHHACVPTHPEPMLQRHTTKPQTLRFSSHTSLFWTLPEQLSILHHACEPTHPEPTSQDTLQTSIRKFSSHTSLFRTLPEQLLTDDTTHVCQPILNQCCKDTPQNLRP